MSGGARPQTRVCSSCGNPPRQVGQRPLSRGREMAGPHNRQANLLASQGVEAGRERQLGEDRTHRHCARATPEFACSAAAHGPRTPVAGARHVLRAGRPATAKRERGRGDRRAHAARGRGGECRQLELRSAAGASTAQMSPTAPRCSGEREWGRSSACATGCCSPRTNRAGWRCTAPSRTGRRPADQASREAIRWSGCSASSAAGSRAWTPSRPSCPAACARMGWRGADDEIGLWIGEAGAML